MNRDEKWDRAAEGIHIWPGEARVVAGKDLEKGGTWLGINRHGFCAALTNLRTSCSSSSATGEKVSRGLLVKRLLEQESFDPPRWLELIRASECAAFNLVFADTRAPRAFVYCSDTDGVAEISLAVPFTLANGCPGAHWPREQRLLELFSSSEQGSSSSSRFMDLLSDCSAYATDPLDYTSLPVRIPPTRAGTVDGALRGTVSSSVITVDHDGNVCFHERQWTTCGESRRIAIKIETAEE